MKSKFARFSDYTLGAALLFFAAFALTRYFTRDYVSSAVCAVMITLTAFTVQKFRSSATVGKQKLSSNAQKMFTEFMYLPPDKPAKLLYSAVKQKLPNAVRRGKGVYCNGCAVFPCLDERTNSADAARMIAAAKHFGAKKLTLLCHAPVTPPVTEGITVNVCSAEETYALFASLGALPKTEFTAPPEKQKRFAAALKKDRAIKYILLAAGLLLFARLTRSIVSFVCACICAALAVASIVLSAKNAIENRK